MFYTIFAAIRSLASAIKKLLTGTRASNDLEQEPQIKSLARTEYTLFQPTGRTGRFHITPSLHSPELIPYLLQKLELRPNSRDCFHSFINLTNSPLFIAKTGPEAMALRKSFIKILPNNQTTLEASIEITRRYLQENNDDEGPAKTQAANLFNKGVPLFLSISILISLLLDTQLTYELEELLEQMTETLLFTDKTGTVKERYHTWVQETLAQLILENKSPQSSSLAKAIDNYTKTAYLSTKDTKPDLEEALSKDPTIHALFTSIITANNVASLLRFIGSSEYLGAYLRVILKEMQEQQIYIDLNASKNQVGDGHVRNLTFLDALYKYALYNADSTPKSLSRYVDEELRVGDVLIPAHTDLDLFHRHAERIHKHSNSGNVTPSFFKNPEMKLGSHLFAPFSIGPRKCPGQYVAEHIFKGILITAACSYGRELTLSGLMEQRLY